MNLVRSVKKRVNRLAASYHGYVDKTRLFPILRDGLDMTKIKSNIAASQINRAGARYGDIVKRLSAMAFSTVLEVGPVDWFSAGAFNAASNGKCQYFGFLNNATYGSIYRFRQGFDSDRIDYGIGDLDIILNNAQPRYDFIAFHDRLPLFAMIELARYGLSHDTGVLIHLYDESPSSIFKKWLAREELRANCVGDAIILDASSRSKEALAQLLKVLVDLDGKADERFRDNSPRLTDIWTDASSMPSGLDQISFDKYVTYNGRFFMPVFQKCETVNFCNNNCIICPYSRQKRQPRTMSMNMFEELLRQHISIGGTKFKLEPKNGEIFLDAFLKERIALIRSCGQIRRLEMVTNAVSSERFNDEDFAYIIENVDHIYISIYGNTREEYTIMAGRDHYDSMVSTIKRIIPHLHGEIRKLTLQFRNVWKTDEATLMDWMRKTFGMVFPYSGGTTAYANWGVLDVTEPLPGDMTWAAVVENTLPCSIVMGGALLFANGDMSICMCADFNHNPAFTLGNIENVSLAEMFSSIHIRNALSGGDSLPTVCRTCTFKAPFKHNSRLRGLSDPRQAIQGGILTV